VGCHFVTNVTWAKVVLSESGSWKTNFRQGDIGDKVTEYNII